MTYSGHKNQFLESGGEGRGGTKGTEEKGRGGGEGTEGEGEGDRLNDPYIPWQYHLLQYLKRHPQEFY